jgi:glycosyltransferase involved in cell wall biosynthesis
MTIRHTIIHQYDPEHHVAGGTPGFIRDLIRHGGAERQFTIIGVTQSSRRPLGRMAHVDIDGGSGAEFLPVARVQDATHKRRIPHTARLVAGLLRFHPTIDADIVHFHRAETAVMCASYMKEAQVVTFLHGAGQAHRSGVGSESFWRAAPPGLYDRIMLTAIRRSDRAYVMDRRKAELLGQRLRNVSVGKNWYDGSAFYCSDGQPTRRKAVIGWVGRLEQSKDPLLAIRVFRELAARGHRFEAWMAGNGPLREMVERELSAADLNMVNVVGLLDPHELAAQLRRSTVCLATSRWEGIPRAIIEALACGVPVVSTDVGDVRSLISPENGVLVEGREPAELIDAIERVTASASPPAVAGSVAHLEAKRVVPSLLSDLEAQLIGGGTERNYV